MKMIVIKNIMSIKIIIKLNLLVFSWTLTCLLCYISLFMLAEQIYNIKFNDLYCLYLSLFWFFILIIGYLTLLVIIALRYLCKIYKYRKSNIQLNSSLDMENPPMSFMDEIINND